jgi:8-oxo-dGTP pyrophosphatase MutT (NUDIX family)
MPMSDYLRDLRAKVGTSLLVVPSATGLVFDPDDRVLMVRHADRGVWVAPGGAVDPGETPQDAVVREVWEETGLWVEPTGLCGVFGGPECLVRYANGDEVSYVTAVFECRRLGGTLHADGEETLEARFVAAAELPALRLSAWAEVILPSLLASRGVPWIPRVTWRPPGVQ